MSLARVRFCATRAPVAARTCVTRFDRIWEPLVVLLAFFVFWFGTL
jgi:hypothetical protein